MNVEIAYNIIVGISVVVAIAIIAGVFLFGKGDAMSGGSSGIRTTFKGKASFEDQIAKVTLITGGIFMLLMLILDAINAQRYDM